MLGPRVVDASAGAFGSESGQGLGLEIDRASETRDETSALETKPVQIKVTQPECHLALRETLEI